MDDERKASKREYRKRWLLTPAGRAYLHSKYKRRYARPDVRAKILRESADYQRRFADKRKDYIRRWWETDAGRLYYARNCYGLPADTAVELVEAYAVLLQLQREIRWPKKKSTKRSTRRSVKPRKD